MSKEIIRGVIDRVLWTCGATKENRELLADTIAEALAPAPGRLQEPFAYMIVDESGEAYFGEFCVASGKTDLEAELEGLNFGQDGEPYKIVPVFRAPVQPVAVPDLISAIVIEVLEAARDFIGANAVPADAKGASESAHQARKMAALIDSVLAHLPAATASQGDAKELTIIELHEAYYAHSGNSKIDYDGREWGDFVGGWDAAIAAKAAS